MRYLYILIILFILSLVVPTSIHASTITVLSGQSIGERCLRVANPGDICNISSGVYNEALVLSRPGPITLKCEVSRGCTVNSISTGIRLDNYTIDGFKILGMVDLTKNAPWSSSKSAVNNGNNGIVIQNSFVDGGGIYIYGHNNIVENTEINCAGISDYGIRDEYAGSHDNINRNNFIHDCNRGIWHMQYTDNTLDEGNVITRTKHSAIDCDGFGHPVTRCTVRNNTITFAEEIGIFTENTFNSQISGNTTDCNSDFGFFNKSYGIATDWTSDGEYRNVNTNSSFINNNICGRTNGLYSQSSPGWIVTGNTIRSTSTSGYAAVSLPQHPDGYPNNNWVFQNNIVYANANVTSILYSGNIVNLISDNNHFNLGARFISNGVAKTIDQWKSLGYDVNSTFGETIVTNNIADLEPDGDVDASDFDILLNNFGLVSLVAGWIRSDIVRNGVIDIYDFNKLITNFGQ